MLPPGTLSVKAGADMVTKVSTIASEASPPIPSLALPKLSAADRLQNLLYSIAGGHAGVWIVSAIYVLIFEAKYRLFGVTIWLKHGWDNLPANAGLRGSWLDQHWDTIRHLYFRNVPEGILGLLLILAVLAKAKPVGPPGRLDKLLVRLGFPSHHQGQLGRHERVSALQVIFSPVTVLLASLPGVIVGSLLIFGLPPLMRHYGVHVLSSFHPPSWTDAYLAGNSWQPLAVGALGGWFYGRKSFSKVADDVQLFFIERWLNRAHAADAILARLGAGTITQTEARDELTDLRATKPGRLYPPGFRHRYRALLNAGVTAEEHGRWISILMPLVVFVLTVLAIFGAYIRLWYAKHLGWLP
jgi:hypothetical protein